MKRILNKTVILAIGLMLVGGAAFGQSIDFEKVENGFGDFSKSLSEALPQASTTGLTWSDARVRGFPHFGVGLSFGVVMLPDEAFTGLSKDLGVELPSELVGDLGVPFPSYAVDGRVGIPFLPIDIGAKLGLLTPGMSESLGGDTAADYMLAGFEVRYPILKGRLLMPAVSVSAGYNYLSGGISTTLNDVGDLGTINVGDLEGIDANTTLTSTAPDLRLDWKTHSFDFKAQVSKNLLIFTPYLGGAYTYGLSSAGGGVSSDLEVNEGSPDTLEDVLTALEKQAGVEASSEGFTILSDVTGGSVRAFGGFSVNLLILKLDLNGQYNFTTQSLGGGINARVQL